MISILESNKPQFKHLEQIPDNQLVPGIIYSHSKEGHGVEYTWKICHVWKGGVGLINPRDKSSCHNPTGTSSRFYYVGYEPVTPEEEKIAMEYRNLYR